MAKFLPSLVRMQVAIALKMAVKLLLKILAEAEGIQAKIAAENSISNANLTAKIITSIWPELADKLPKIVTALAPQPGVLGDTRIY
ncbi:hypothetical protein LC609_05830 [Nostoc sp. XA013]|nr:hypothetical protein [Nostoc sp. XA013]